MNHDKHDPRTGLPREEPERESNVSSRPFPPVRFSFAAPAKGHTNDEILQRGGAGNRLKVPRRWRVALAGLAALNLVIGAFLGDAGHAVWRAAAERISSDPPPLPEQLNNVISDAAKNGYSLVGSVHLIQFRAGGELSRVLLLRPISSDEHRSDELRIYDIVGQGKQARMKLRLLFQPLPTKRTAMWGLPLSASRTAEPRAFAIRLRLIRDLDGKPGNEVVADVSEYAVKPIWPRPVYIYWDPANQRYAVRGLLSPATTGQATMRHLITRFYLRRADVYATAVINQIYLPPTTIVNAGGASPPVKAYAVEAYVLKKESLHDPRGTTAGGLALTAGYIVRSSGYGTADLLQVLTWHIDLRHDPPIARASATHPTVLRVGTNGSRLAALLVRTRM